jgi:hypothetical protein
MARVSSRFTLNEPALAAETMRILHPWFSRLMTYAEQEGSNEAPKRTHRLANSVEGKVTPYGVLPIRGSLSANTSYANIVIKGSRSHPIDARRAKVLTDFGRGGNSIFGVHVDHPGTQPNNFLARAMSAALIRHGLRGIRE